MKRLEGDRVVTCLQCGIQRAPNVLGWEIYTLGETNLFLCPRHAEAFALGVEWASRDRRNKEAALERCADDSRRRLGESAGGVKPRCTDEQLAQQQAEQHEARRRRVEARMSRVFGFNSTPEQIYTQLSQWVVGQDETKRTLASALRAHYRRVQMRMIQDGGKVPPIDPDIIPKETLLVIGPTGCGKTHLLRTAARVVDVPFRSVSMTAYTEEGYVGDSVESILSGLIPLADNYLPLAEKGMVFLDEVDKKARRALGMSSYRDVSGEGVQMGLLAMLDTGGSRIHVPSQVTDRKQGGYSLVEFDTRDTFFVLGGAFLGLAEIIAKRVGGKESLGFAAPSDAARPSTARDAKLRVCELLHAVQPEDIVEYGFVPELVGRIGSIAVVDPLSRDDMRRIMLDVDDAVVKQQQARAQLEGFELEITAEAVDAICEQACQSGMGARRLRSLTSEIVARLFFAMPSQRRATGKGPKVIITTATVTDPTAYEVNWPTKPTVRRMVRQKAAHPDTTEATRVRTRAPAQHED